MPRTGGSVPRHPRPWPSSGWPAPIPTSRRWVTASGRWPRSATPFAPRSPRPRPARRPLARPSPRSTPPTPPTATGLAGPNVRPRLRASASAARTRGCVGRITSSSRRGSVSRRSTKRSWSSSRGSASSGSPVSRRPPGSGRDRLGSSHSTLPPRRLPSTPPCPTMTRPSPTRQPRSKPRSPW